MNIHVCVNVSYIQSFCVDDQFFVENQLFIEIIIRVRFSNKKMSQSHHFHRKIRIT